MGYTVPTSKERYACENSILEWEEDAFAGLGRSSRDKAQHVNHEIAKRLVREKSLNNAIEEIMTFADLTLNVAVQIICYFVFFRLGVIYGRAHP